jgi:hypothetical protein
VLNRQVPSSNVLEDILEDTCEDDAENDLSKTDSMVININQYINKDDIKDNLKNEDNTQHAENKSEKESDESEDIESSDSSTDASGYGEITIGSKKGNNGIVPKITIGKGNDNASISTVDAEHINLKTLKAVDTYTKKELEKIAKVYSLASTYKSADGKRVQYKKEDLYQLIKDHLNTKNKNL